MLHYADYRREITKTSNVLPQYSEISKKLHLLGYKRRNEMRKYYEDR